jgi:toxin YoeB
MINITFTNKAWGEYCYWQVQDKKTLKKINMILADIQRNNFVGVGKPEPLKNDFAGYWSRRIDSSNRLIYRINNNQIEVIQCKGHYE